MGDRQTLLSVPFTSNRGDEPSVPSHPHSPTAALRPGRGRHSQSCSPKVQGEHPSTALCSASSAQPWDNQSPSPQRLPRATVAAVLLMGSRSPGELCVLLVWQPLPRAQAAQPCRQLPRAGVRVMQWKVPPCSSWLLLLLLLQVRM